MQPNYKILGKVCLTANGKWDKTKQYDKISVVFNDVDNTSYISRQDVPAGIEITNEEYWQVIGNRGVAIIVDDKLNGTSTNPIQNKAVYTAIQGLDGKIELIDDDVTSLKTDNDFIKKDVSALMDKVFPFKVAVSIDKTLAQKGTSQAVKVTITPKIGDDNTNVDEIMINGAEYHGATPYVHSDTATATTTYNVRVRKDTRTAQGSATITFVNPSYDGAVAANFTVTEANIKTLTEAIRSGKGGTRTFNLNNQKACIAYPKAFGAATNIKDANGFDYLASYTRSELNVNGELYYVYLLTNATTITDMKQTVS